MILEEDVVTDILGHVINGFASQRLGSVPLDLISLLRRIISQHFKNRIPTARSNGNHPSFRIDGYDNSSQFSPQCIVQRDLPVRPYPGLLTIE